MFRSIRFPIATLVVWVLAGADARGQQLIEVGGVELRGAAQLVIPGGGTCNVAESDTSFEARQGNDGAPMDIWRLDFTVRNGSGRWLDHVIARYQIESEWPECTNWDRVTSTELTNVAWSDWASFIQRTGRNVVRPDEVLTESQYFIVLHGDPPPRFSNWSVDFDYAVNAPEAGAAAVAPVAVAGAQQPAGGATAEQENLFWQSIADSANPAMFEAYLEQFPNGVFRPMAQVRLADLREQPDVPAAGIGPIGITSHRNNQRVTSRIVEIEGEADPRGGSEISVLFNDDVQGVLLQDGVFRSAVVLRSGLNEVRVCQGDNCATLMLNADIEALGLMATLAWSNGDLDLHVETPSGDECYFGNTQVSGGCELDIDDLDGSNPENMSVPADARPGLYRFWVVNYGGGEGASGTLNIYRDGSLVESVPFVVNVGDGETVLSRNVNW